MTLFVFFVAEFLCFSIFLLLITFSIIFKGFSRLKKTKTEQEILKDCSVARNSKHFGSLQLLVIPEHTWEPLMPYIGNILCTIYTYVIWMKVLWTKLCVFFMKKMNGFCVKSPCFLWLQSTFCSAFCFSLSEETEFFSLSLGCFFCYLYFLDVLWNSYQLLLILLIGERCFIWTFHLVSFFILN